MSADHARRRAYGINLFFTRRRDPGAVKTGVVLSLQIADAVGTADAAVHDRHTVLPAELPADPPYFVVVRCDDHDIAPGRKREVTDGGYFFAPIVKT